MRTSFTSPVSQRSLLLRRRKRRLLLIFSIAFFVIIFLGYFFFFSNFFRVKKIEINQTRFLKKEEIIKNIEQFLVRDRLWGIFPQNFFSLYKKNFIFLLKEFPSLKDFQIKKDFFQRKINFFLEEREIEGIYCQNREEKECFYFDSSGLLFSEAPEVEGFLIFLLENSRPSSLKIGDQLLSSRSFLQFLEIKKILEKKERINKVSLLEKEIIFELVRGTKIYFNISEFNQLPLVLENFLEGFNLKDLEYVDFRYLPNIYFKSFSNY